MLFGTEAEAPKTNRQTQIKEATANDRSVIDKVVCLNTVPQLPELKVEYIPASANLLAAEVYKVHRKLAESR